ncbi:MAG: DNA topoisomerase 3, partial [Flavobacteriaceae bacterium]
MKVCIAEKPSVAKEIAQILGANTRRDGYFEGEQYCVTWTFGHLCTLYTPDDYKPHWKRWDFNTLPMLPERFETKVIDNPGVQKQFNSIKNLFQKADTVINCGDAGIEGEVIQRWVIEKTGYTGPVERLWISSLTPEAIKEGFANLKPAENYDLLYHAGSSRAIGDWLLGMNATRLYTLKYGRDRQVLSLGRVQTPTLAMLVERYLEIQNFKPQPYWELQTEFKNGVFAYEEGKFLNKEAGEKVLQEIETEDFEIIEVTKKKGKELPPSLFDLTGLQVYCNNKFGYSADQTLKVAQSLYEKKLITYPRVDTTYLPDDIYPKIPEILSGLSKYAKFTSSLLGQEIKKSKKVFDNKKVTDHHAIIPTGYEGGMSEMDAPVYDAIVKRFIAAFYPDCIVANTNMKGQVLDYIFKANGKVIVSPGWREVLHPKSSQTQEKSKDKLLPDLKKGDRGAHKPLFVEKQTSAPKQYTEATLLRAMETAGKKVEDEELRDLMKANGIGRPSTRANIIETLFRRKYIKKEKKNLIPTSVGVQLIQTIGDKQITSAKLTGLWEKKLKDIEQGEYSAALFIREMKQMVDELVVQVRLEQHQGIRQMTPTSTKKSSPKKAGLSTEKCPKCKEGTLLKGSENYGCSNYSKGCDFLMPFKFEGKKISDTQFKKLLKKGKTDLLKGFKISDQKINAFLSFDQTYKLMLNPEKSKTTSDSNSLICPRCNKGEIQKGKTAFGCANYNKGC